MRSRAEERQYRAAWVRNNLKRAREIARFANRRHKLKLAMLRVLKRAGVALP